MPAGTTRRLTQLLPWEVALEEKFGSDVGAGADIRATGNPVATLARAETGEGADVLSQAEAILARSEAGSGVEALLARLIYLVETGLGLDALVELLETLEKISADSGQGVDVRTALIITLIRLETGEGLEALLSRALATAEAGSGLDEVMALLEIVAKYSADYGYCGQVLEG